MTAEPDRLAASHEDASRRPFSMLRLLPFALAGAVIGACPANWLGASFIASVGAQPLGPGEVACGMPALSGLLIILFGAPAGAVLLGLAGVLAGAAWQLLSSRSKAHSL